LPFGPFDSQKFLHCKKGLNLVLRLNLEKFGEYFAGGVYGVIDSL
jgi:hypothetical protein